MTYVARHQSAAAAEQRTREALRHTEGARVVDLDATGRIRRSSRSRGSIRSEEENHDPITGKVDPVLAEQSAYANAILGWDSQLCREDGIPLGYDTPTDHDSNYPVVAGIFREMIGSEIPTPAQYDRLKAIAGGLSPAFRRDREWAIETVYNLEMDAEAAAEAAAFYVVDTHELSPTQEAERKRQRKLRQIARIRSAELGS